MIENHRIPDKEKRQYSRFEKSFPVSINLTKPASSFEAVAQNVSQEGMMLKLDVPEEFSSLSPGGTLDVIFKLLPAQTIFKSTAQIVWIEKPKLGIKFIHPPSSQAEILINEFIELMKEQTNRQRTSTLSFGWFNSYVPEEILYAAGFIPYRIMGKPAHIVKAKAALSGNINPFVQTCLESALDGDFNSFAGVVIGNADDASRRLYDIWKKYLKTDFVHIVDIPKTIELRSIERYKMELSCLIKSLEEHFKIRISTASLKRAIDLFNETRKLLMSLHLLRKKQETIISSSQFLLITLASTTVFKEFFNPRLKVLLEKLEFLAQEQELLGKDVTQKRRPRLLLTGGFLDSPALANIVERADGILVCEDTCAALRYFRDLVDTAIEDPLLALAGRYLAKSPGARMLDLNRRFEYIWSLIKEYKVDGVIYYALKFDDPYLFEFPELRNWLQSKDIPVIFLESDHRFANIGQLRTRIQAFVETLALKIR